MAFTGIEPIIVELKRRLEEELQAEIDLINAEVEDGYPAGVPQQIYDYIPPVGELNYFPSIGIGDGPMRFEDDIGSSETALFTPMIVVYEQAASQQELAWRLRRLNQAVIRTVMAGRHLGEAAWGVTLQGSDPGPTLADDPSSPKEWVSWTGIRITCRRDEE